MDIFAFACLFFILLYLLRVLNYAIALYELNPFTRPKPLNLEEIETIAVKVGIVRSLDIGQRMELFQRISWFRAKKNFVYRKNVTHKKELELLISTAGCLLTLGLKDFKFKRSVRRIVIYPSDYYSIINRKFHVGEYNPGLRTLVFAADSLKSGFKEGDDNINLALHEFAHALCLETLRKRTWEARRFHVGLRQIKAIFQQDAFQEKLSKSKYFRAYGQTNLFEFFAVMIEGYFETPERFKKEFSTLYEIIQSMLNIEVSIPRMEGAIKRTPEN